jgi:2-succinyl-5-enolpyruvyl-6-hydroxy-3-cyclohexene-1-carboxylate synthase
MSKYYTEEKNALILVALLKEHGVKKIIASPGSTNIAVVQSLRNDSFFELFSAVDERSAAYMACGLAYESGEPVAISCTGATSARNYFPGLTEAFYRKLPVLAITSTQAISKASHLIAQVIDNTKMPSDLVKHSVTLPIVKDEDDFWDCEIKVNNALLELRRKGGGPVHINIPTTYDRSFTAKVLPKVRVIKRITSSSIFPELPKGKIAVFMGTHPKWSKEMSKILDSFCAANNAVVFCDHTSSYKGKYRVQLALIGGQKLRDISKETPETLIYIGELTGDYYSLGLKGKSVWRVCEDGEIRDTFRTLQYVFEMPEVNFFEQYKGSQVETENYLEICKSHLERLYDKMPDFPFSNIWVASKLAALIPENSSIHFGILNSLRSWNFFPMKLSVDGSSNVGGFGIDGNLSTLIGSSLARREKLFFGVIGDLAFFYDMNALGNRHVGNNLRILVVNNGKGTEFRLNVHPAFQNDINADEFIAAAGHYGNKSETLVKNYAENLGFEYMSAANKVQFESVYEKFVDVNILDKSIIFEVFTEGSNEDEALEAITNIEEDIAGKMKQITKRVLGEDSVKKLKKIFK